MRHNTRHRGRSPRHPARDMVAGVWPSREIRWPASALLAGREVACAPHPTGCQRSPRCTAQDGKLRTRRPVKKRG